MNGTSLKQHPILFYFVFSLFVGAVVAFIVALSLSFPLKWAVACLVGFSFCFVALAVKDLESFLLFFYFFLLPLNYAKLIGKWTYEFHVGGAPPGGYDFYLSDIFLIALLVTWYLRATTRRMKSPIRFGMLDFFFIGFLAWEVFSFTGTMHIGASFFEWTRWVRYYFLYLYLSNNIRDERKLRIILWAIMLGLMGQVFICYLQFLLSKFFSAMGRTTAEMGARFGWPRDLARSLTGSLEYVRGGGTVGPLNVEAMYFGAVIPLALVTVFCLKRASHKAAMIVVLGAALGASILTFSKGGWLNMAFSFGLIFLVGMRARLLQRNHLITVVMIGFFLLGLIFSIPTTRKTITHRLLFKDPEVTIQPRVTKMRIAAEMIRDYPLLGVGLNTFDRACEAYYRSPVEYKYMPVHNRLLLFASEIGIIGMLFYVMFLWKAFSRSLLNIRAPTPFLSYISLGSAGVLVGAFIHMNVDIFDSYIINSLVIAHAGLATAIMRMRETDTTTAMEKAPAIGGVGH